jgi:Fe-S cluster assembly protein SufD
MTDRTTTESVLTAFADRERSGAAEGPSWLREQRRRAIERFAERGLPTTRDEEWKYTSIAPLTAVPLDFISDGRAGLPAGEALAPFIVAATSSSRLVFVDGRYAPKLSTVRSLPEGGHLGSLAGALITEAEVVRPHLAAEASGEAFGALNTAFWADGAFLRIPAGTRLEGPVELLFVTTPHSAARAVQPRSLIVLEAESRIALVESYVALGAAAAYLTNAVTDVVLRPGAEIDHYRIVLEGREAVHLGQTRVHEQRESRFASCTLAFGGRLVRSEVEALLEAEGAECHLSGLFVIGGDQHVDIRTVVDHTRPRALSRQLYKGVLDGRARGVFNGRVVVRPGAIGTNAHQTNKNLLLSDGVEVDSKPQLEIFADDVRCSHGAADGQLAEEAVFYLRSRGLDEAAARSLLAHGFANEVLGRIRVESIRNWCAALLSGRLRGGRVVEAST